MKKGQKDLLFHVDRGDRRENPSLLRVVLGAQTTRLDFGYVTTNRYIKGGWITIAPDTHLRVHGSERRYLLKEVSGIALAPEKLNFESNKDYQFFSLYFEALPLENLRFDMIEEYVGSENDFNFYDISLKLEEGISLLD